MLTERGAVDGNITQDEYIAYLTEKKAPGTLDCFFCKAEEYHVIGSGDFCAIFTENTTGSAQHSLGIRCTNCGMLYKHDFFTVRTWLDSRQEEDNNE